MSFLPTETSEEALRLHIEALGYEVQDARGSTNAVRTRESREFVVPPRTPAFFREAVGRARATNRPLVIIFGANWCAPCQRLKSETLENVSVASLLATTELVNVDLDGEPELGRFYVVSSVPCVLFVDTRGAIVDRLVGFEPPSLFVSRLKGVLNEAE